MTSKLPSNGRSLPKAPSEKAAFIAFAERELNLRPDCSVVDLDIPSHIQTIPEAELGVWLDTWHKLVDVLGTRDDAKEGIEAARDILFLVSCRLPNMLFSADGTKPPLDQFGPPGRGLRMLFETSTCYRSINPVAMYRGRVVYWGSQPSVKWTADQCIQKDVRYHRLMSSNEVSIL